MRVRSGITLSAELCMSLNHVAPNNINNLLNFDCIMFSRKFKCFLLYTNRLMNIPIYVRSIIIFVYNVYL